MMVEVKKRWNRKMAVFSTSWTPFSIIFPEFSRGNPDKKILWKNLVNLWILYFFIVGSSSFSSPFLAIAVQQSRKKQKGWKADSTAGLPVRISPVYTNHKEQYSRESQKKPQSLQPSCGLMWSIALSWSSPHWVSSGIVQSGRSELLSDIPPAPCSHNDISYHLHNVQMIYSGSGCASTCRTCSGETDWQEPDLWPSLEALP